MTFNGTVSGTHPYIVQILQGADQLSGGMLGLVIIILVFFITYMANRTSAVNEAFASASWVMLAVAILLRLLGMLQDFYLGVSIVFALGSLVLLYFKN